MKCKLKLFGRVYDLVLVKDKYTNNSSLALEAQDSDGPFATLSVNLPESSLLPGNVCFFKTWSENEGILEQLEEQGLVKRLATVAENDNGCKAQLVEILF